MNRLRDLREYNNLKLSDIESILGKRLTAISKYELEELEMSTDTLCKLADYFKTSVDYILYNTNDAKPHMLTQRKNKNRLKELRKENNISQDRISKILFMSQNGYSNYETGRLDLPYNVLLKLSDYYNTSIDYLLCRTDDSSEYPKNKV